MKNSILAAIAFAALAVGAIGCSGTPCDEVATYSENATRDACAGKDCQFCVCYLNGEVVNSTGDGCEPYPEVEETECEGAARDQAQSCLDTGTCEENLRAAAQASVDAICP